MGKKRHQRIEVTFRVDGTTKDHTFTATRSSVTMLRRGRAIIDFTDGADDAGPVRDVVYRCAEMIIRRPLRG